MPDIVRLASLDKLFIQRERRFRQLAHRGTALSEYLLFLGDLVETQQSIYQSLSGMSLDIYTEHKIFFDLVQKIMSNSRLRRAAIEAKLDNLGRVSPNIMSEWFKVIRDCSFEGVDPEYAPFLGAAIQLLMAVKVDCSNLQEAEKRATTYQCPVCGGLPVAGILQTGSEVQGLRYLNCSLCGSEWCRPRVQCVICGSGEKLSLYAVEAISPAVKAEACDQCRIYIKDSHIDVLADDIFSLGLDVLMANVGYQRLGFNPMMTAKA
jgi:FdhE protein